jgi:hypothetical protein
MFSYHEKDLLIATLLFGHWISVGCGRITEWNRGGLGAIYATCELRPFHWVKDGVITT